jgi:hypothetical protein
VNEAQVAAPVRQHGVVKSPLALAAVLLMAACGTQHPDSQAVTTVQPDRAGHQFDTPDADHVLVAGDELVLGTTKLTVWGPELARVPTLVPAPKGQRHHYLATFRIVSNRPVTAAEFRLLAIADQIDGAARVTTAAAVTKVVNGALTWTAPFVEGHGELLYTPPGATRPVALWDFRAES